MRIWLQVVEFVPIAMITHGVMLYTNIFMPQISYNADVAGHVFSFNEDSWKGWLKLSSIVR
jgi:hypothetical protein